MLAFTRLLERDCYFDFLFAFGIAVDVYYLWLDLKNNGLKFSMRRGSCASQAELLFLFLSLLVSLLHSSRAMDHSTTLRQRTTRSNGQVPVGVGASGKEGGVASSSSGMSRTNSADRVDKGRWRSG